MEKCFNSNDGRAVLAFLKKQFKAEVPYVGDKIAYFRLNHTEPDGDVIGFTEVAHRRYQSFFERFEPCLLYELPLVNYALVYCLYCPEFLQDELSQKFGGFAVGNYWMLNNETRSYYGYTCEELPTVQDVIDFLRSYCKS